VGAPEGQGRVRAARGLSPRSERILYAAAEALLSDVTDAGALIPGPEETCSRGVSALSLAVGLASSDLRRGYAVLLWLLEALPLFVIGAPRRMSRLPLERRVAYLEALEMSRVGLLAMLFVAIKVPLCIPALEEGDELTRMGFDRPSTAARRVLAVLPLGAARRATEAGP
jgi:hypothetical protein